MALAYETNRPQKGTVDGQAVSWQERLLVVYSLSLARQLRRNLNDRLSRCMEELVELSPPRARGRRQWYELEGLQAAVRSLLKKHQVEGLLEVSYEREVVVQRQLRRYRDHPARREETVRYVVRVKRNSAAIATARRLLGWRLYGTNAPSERLGLSSAIWAYRGSPCIEHDFHRLKGPLGIRPLYLQREDHTRGLVRLLSLALRVLTVVEHVVRKGLKATTKTLSGLYAANPKRMTPCPTTERLLSSFQGITLTVVHLSEGTIRHVTPLSDLQRAILALLGLPCSIYGNPAQPAPPIPP